jgi:hypothetical protein
MILIKIDVTKIDKAKLYKGAKGTYLDICLIETPNSQYEQDFMAVQGVSKEERAAGKKGAILGNAKHMGSRRAPANTGSKPADYDSDPPF